MSRIADSLPGNRRHKSRLTSSSPAWMFAQRFGATGKSLAIQFHLASSEWSYTHHVAAVFLPYDKRRVRHDLLPRHKLEPYRLGEGSQDQMALHHGKVAANADARACAEGHESVAW